MCHDSHSRVHEFLTAFIMIPITRTTVFSWKGLGICAHAPLSQLQLHTWRDVRKTLVWIRRRNGMRAEYIKQDFDWQTWRMQRAERRGGWGAGKGFSGRTIGE